MLVVFTRPWDFAPSALQAAWSPTNRQGRFAAGGTGCAFDAWFVVAVVVDARVEKARKEADEERFEGHDACNDNGNVDFESGPIGERAGAVGHVHCFGIFGIGEVNDADQRDDADTVG